MQLNGLFLFSLKKNQDAKCNSMHLRKSEIWTHARIRLKDSDLTITNSESSAKLIKKPLGLDYKLKKN